MGNMAAKPTSASAERACDTRCDASSAARHAESCSEHMPTAKVSAIRLATEWDTAIIAPSNHACRPHARPRIAHEAMTAVFAMIGVHVASGERSAALFLLIAPVPHGGAGDCRRPC